jgi:Protein of unknown function (DUF3551)
MKQALLVVGLLAASAAFASAAQAQNYPWCAQYGRGMGGAMNCGFTSFQQCLATVSGIGGFCERNNTYVPPGVKRRHRSPQ